MENITGSPIHRIFEEAINQGNMAVVDELIAPDHLAHHSFGEVPNCPQGIKWWISLFRVAFPDLHCTVEDEINQGDKVAAHWVMRGTQKGLFLGNKPTGKQVEVQGMIFARLENGRMIEDWMLIDQMGILQQLGIVPPHRNVPAHAEE